MNENKAVVPLDEFLPGYDWAGDKMFMQYARDLTEREVEFAKAQVYMPKGNHSACLRKVCPTLTNKTINGVAFRLAKNPNICRMVEYLTVINEKAFAAKIHKPVGDDEIVKGYEQAFRKAVKDNDNATIAKMGELIRSMRPEDAPPTQDGVAEAEFDVDRTLAEVLNNGNGKAKDGDTSSNRDTG